MNVRLADKKILKDSIVDGDGLRSVIWFQGCAHNCLGCHNPNTHDFNSGYLTTTEEIKKELDNLKLQDGITLSGGDPFFQIEAATDIAKYAKEIGLNVWAYTGFTFEQLLNNDKALELLKNINVLVDGRFELEHRSLSTKFRGSTNQRIINVKKSLNDKKACIIRKYNQKSDYNSKHKKDFEEKKLYI